MTTTTPPAAVTADAVPADADRLHEAASRRPVRWDAAVSGGYALSDADGAVAVVRPGTGRFRADIDAPVPSPVRFFAWFDLAEEALAWCERLFAGPPKAGGGR